ncbi:MAG: FKBP-type peptidyl-prolyl cis-trans isomerase [Amphritea sp.]
MIFRYLGLVALLVAVVAVSGCGESEEQKRFHQELLDKALNDEVKKAGDAFLAENSTLPGIRVTDTGLQYAVLQEAQEGQGEYPGINDAVRVDYQGWRVDGELFESSLQRNEKPIFPVKRVVKGWRAALMKMRVGDRWKIFLPSELAYGAISPSEQIPANSALIFEIELLEIMPAEQVE